MTMTIPTLSQVRDEVKRVAEIIRRLEAVEHSAKDIPDEHVRLTVTNCLEAALKTLREDQNELEHQFRNPQVS